ncbi:hypothetical protein [Pseudothermotoga sp.]
MDLLLVFVGVLLDHVGVPVLLVASVSSMADAREKFFLILLSAMFALLLTDLVTLYLGKYLKKVAERPKTSLLPNVKSFLWFEKIMNEASNALLEPGSWTVIFAKFMPAVGKFVPLFLGYSGFSTKNLALLLLGDLIYALTYIVLSYRFGEAIRQRQFFIVVVLVGLFVLLYFLSHLSSKRRSVKVDREGG